MTGPISELGGARKQEAAPLLLKKSDVCFDKRNVDPTSFQFIFLKGLTKCTFEMNPMDLWNIPSKCQVTE